MSLADISIKRPVFITAIITVIVALGTISFQRLGVDLFPNVTFPYVMVTTIYPGAGPNEIETLISKPMEDEISTIAGIKRLSSVNVEGMSRVFAEFTMETDAKYAESQIRDRVTSAKKRLPLDTQEPIIRRLDPADQAIVILAVSADVTGPKLFDIADTQIRPRLEQINQVGLVEIMGGRKREIQVQLDRNKLKDRELSLTQISSRLASAGENVPVGKTETSTNETVLRTIGEFRNIHDIENTTVNFYGSDVPTTISDLGKVVDTQADEISRAYLNGKQSLFINIYRQSGANTLAVVDAITKKIAKINSEMSSQPGHAKITLVRDGAKWIRANVDDVKESIFLGVILAVMVVYLFLANGRSTIITGLALPNSLIGSFILIAAAGFTINLMSLLALSLSVGLLIDDAIVVRENIFRHIEMGKSPTQAAKDGTDEVRLAVIATTLAVIAVFGPVGFLKGITGQFFKEFGLTICFAMSISLFDALTVAPMLSAYFAGRIEKRNPKSLWSRTAGVALNGFERFQTWLEGKYESVIAWTLVRPKTVLVLSAIIFLVSASSIFKVTKTFLPTADQGEFIVAFDLPQGTSLEATSQVAAQVDGIIRSHPEVEVAALTTGGGSGDANLASFYVRLIPSKKRSSNTSQVKAHLRESLKDFAYANIKVKDYDGMGVGQRPFNVVILGNDQKALDETAAKALAIIKKNANLLDVDSDFRPGKPEFQVDPDLAKARSLGVSSKAIGYELRGQITGLTPVKFRENGQEYDIRVRLLDSQRDLQRDFEKTYVPNMNFNLVRLADFAKPISTRGPSNIMRQDRARYVQISADIAPGKGMGGAMSDIDAMFKSEVPLPEGISYRFIGQAESFQEMGESMIMAMAFGVLFIYLVLASLYESFITPFTIMLALPLAICGSFIALYATNESINIFSMIGVIMLLGVATKNSILLVDYANQLIGSGMSRVEALKKAGTTRLRPILMTTMALIAGTFPIALGLNEASKMRTGMGIAIIGGLISSTLLTLVVIPAAFCFIDDFRLKTLSLAKKYLAPKN